MGYGLGRANAESKAAARTVVLTSADAHFRARLRQQLTAMRWQVREAGGGAEAILQLEAECAEAMVLDGALPDLEVGEFARQMRSRHPVMDLLRVDAGVEEVGPRSPRRNELLHALRRAQEESSGGGELVRWTAERVNERGAVERLAAGTGGRTSPEQGRGPLRSQELSPSDISGDRDGSDGRTAIEVTGTTPRLPLDAALEGGRRPARASAVPLPEMVGESAEMLELAHMVRLVAPRSTPVLIQGDTGTGKELVARAVHLLSPRASKAFVVLNCAAIPEALLEAELFGHTRGAFTGAVQSRTGRIEAAHGGTLFLDEIGEMPLALQAKMLRFLESGELQRVGENETLRVEVRVVAASHQPLLQRTKERAFRLDLYHRLAVFPVFVPALKDRMVDVPRLAAYLLERLGAEMPVKRLSPAAATRLMEHDWPGNVRELAHVLERAVILAEDRRVIGPEEIRF